MAQCYQEGEWPPPDETVTNQETSIAGPNDAPIPESPSTVANYVIGALGALAGGAGASLMGGPIAASAALGGAAMYMKAADSSQSISNADGPKYLPPLNNAEPPKPPVPVDEYDTIIQIFKIKAIIY